MTINKEKINITAEPTKMFRFLIDELEGQKKKVGGKSRSESEGQEKRGGKDGREKKGGKKRRGSSSPSQS